MTWQAVTLIAFIPVTIWVMLAWHSWVTYCEMKKRQSDNEREIAFHKANVEFEVAKIPRSIFGSGIPATPAAMHHSGGIGKAQVQSDIEQGYGNPQ